MQPVVSPEPTREHAKMIIPFEDSDFDPAKADPINTPFCLPHDDTRIKEDVQSQLNQRKQQHLTTIHECLGHLSFV